MHDMRHRKHGYIKSQATNSLPSNLSKEAEPGSFLDRIPSTFLFMLLGMGIFGSFSIYAFLQEKLIAFEKTDAALPLLSQVIQGLIVSATINLFISLKDGTNFKGFGLGYAKLGLLNNITVMLSNTALLY